MKNKIKNLRKQIDKIDNELLNLLLKRKKLVSRVGKEKKKKGIKVINENREKEIILRIKNKAKGKREQNYLVEIFNSIIRNSRKIQN